MANTPSGKPLGGLARAFAAMRGRLYTPPDNLIAGVSPQAWPSALQPIQGVAPKGSQPLTWSYWNGINQEITPRSDTALTFADLRNLATYPLARICIENVKDILTNTPWKIQLKQNPGESTLDWKKRQKNDKVAQQLTEVWNYPDGVTPWGDWWRPIIDDLLVIDAPAYLIDRTLDGKVARMRWSDGSQFLRLIDDQGNIPQGDSPAFTQLWEGMPRLLLTTRQLVYRPSNIVPRNSYASKLYGMSIVEQLAQEIEIGQQRLNFVLAYYTSGSIPNILHLVPTGITPDKINETMQWMDSELSGNLAARRKYRMMQGFTDDAKDQVIQLKEPVMADIFDDLHIRKMAYGFGVSAQRLLKQMNRASAESGQDAAEKEGTMPRLLWMKRNVDYTLQRQQDQPNYELIFDTDDELDATKQAEVDKTRVQAGLETIDETREDRGLVPFGLPETMKPIIVTTMGVQPLEGSFDRVNQQMENDTAQANKPTPAPVAAQGKKWYAARY